MRSKLHIITESARAAPAHEMLGLETMRGCAGERVLLALPDGAVAAASKPTNAAEATGAPSSGAAARQAAGSEASAHPLAAASTASASHAHLRHL